MSSLLTSPAGDLGVEGVEPLLPQVVRLLEGLDGLADDYDVETVVSPGGVVHQIWNRRA